MAFTSASSSAGSGWRSPTSGLAMNLSGLGLGSPPPVFSPSSSRTASATLVGSQPNIISQQVGPQVPDPDVEDIFKDALKEFKKDLDTKYVRQWENTTLASVQQEINRIQVDQDRLRSLMDMSRIRPFLEGMEQFSKLVEVFLNTSEFVAFVWGPLKFIFQMAKNFTDAFDLILDAYEKIGKKLNVLKEYQADEILNTHPYLRQCLGFIYKDILTFHHHATTYLRKKLWRQIFKSMWKTFESTFGVVLKSLDFHSQLLQEQAHLIHNRIYRGYNQDMMAEIHRHKDQWSKYLTEAKEAEKVRRDNQQDNVIQWISASPDTENQQRRFCEVRKDFPDSGKWILEERDVKNWITIDPDQPPDHSMLWLTGKMGAGKSILASLIVEQCQGTAAAKTSYFYCKQDDAQNTCIAILRGILRQLLMQKMDLLPVCDDKRLAGGEVNLHNDSVARTLIETFCASIDQQFIIIDGLDECKAEEIKQIVTFFTSLVDKSDNSTVGKLRLLIVSRQLPELKKLLGRANMLELNHQHNRKDIRDFLDAKALELRDTYNMDLTYCGHIAKEVLDHAHGMFLYANLAMENLLKSGSQRDLIEAFDELRSGQQPLLNDIEKAYKAILDRLKLNQHEWHIAERLFGWLSCSKYHRSLRLNEIQAVISINVRNEGFDFDLEMLRRHIHNYCGSFIHIIGENKVEFVHSSARDYITDNRKIAVEKVEYDMTITFLSYLSFNCFQPGLSAEQRKEYALKGHYALQDYAVSKWWHHLTSMVDHSAEVFLNVGADDIGRRDLDEQLRVALRRFRGRWQTSLNLLSPDQEQLAKTEHVLSQFRYLSCYEDLKYVYGQLLAHYEGSFETRNKVSISDLEKSLTLNREELEKLTPHHVASVSVNNHVRVAVSNGQNGGQNGVHTNGFASSSSSSANQQPNGSVNGNGNGASQSSGGTVPAGPTTLAVFYGHSMYKCKRLACDYFIAGFDTAEKRDAHQKRHERPFACEVTDCQTGQFGFSSNKDLERHKKNYHSDLPANGADSPFPSMSNKRRGGGGADDAEATASAAAAVNKEEVEKARFNCTLCDKRFTRKINQVSHTRSHYGERPYQCGTCGKAFTRVNDQRRHEKIHNRR